MPGYDYTLPGTYFVTIRVHDGECLLGQIGDGEMHLSRFGQVAGHYWKRIPDHAAYVNLDQWVIMPNHIHGIVVISGRGWASLEDTSSTGALTTAETQLSDPGAPRDAPPLRQPRLQARSLGAIVGNYKSVTTRRINRLSGTPGIPFWQRNYWEHIIRNDASLERIRAYIQDNPSRWVEDRLHPDRAHW